MTKAEAIAHFTGEGEAEYQGVKRLADVLHVTVNAVYQWPDALSGRFFFHQCALEVLTRGQLRADVGVWMQDELRKRSSGCGPARECA